MRSALLILGATVSWGLWAIFDKLALRGMHPALVQLVCVVVGVVTLPLYWLVYRHAPGHSWDVPSLGWAVLGAIATLAATLAYLVVLVDNRAGDVAGYTAMYPLVTTLVAALFLGERLTASRVLGMGLILGGAWLLGR